MDELQAYKQALQRERELRQQAEHLLEEKSRELYDSLCELEQTNRMLEQNRRQLVQADKMASLGIISAGVAHEINNPIGFVSSNVNMLAENMRVMCRCFESFQRLLSEATDMKVVKAEWAKMVKAHELGYVLEDSEDIITDTTEGLRRVSQIVADLRVFARNDNSAAESMDVNECVRSALNIMQGELDNIAEVEVEYGNLPIITGFPGKLTQVLVNLLSNASYATPADGRIHVSTSENAGGVSIYVNDTGHGIKAEHLDHLFTPFFTTKPVGDGTGLGLSISYGLIQEHGGRIEVSSEPGQGTQFHIWLPLQAG